MNKLIEIVYDIIGLEKGISRIIVNYFYVENILDNEFKENDITDIACWYGGSFNFEWITDNHFFCFDILEQMCNVYDIRKNIVHSIKLDNVVYVYKIAIFGNRMLIVGSNPKEELVFKYDCDNFKYDCDNKKACLLLTLPRYILAIAIIDDDVITIHKNYIINYDYHTGKMIASKCVLANDAIIVRDNIIINEYGRAVYIIDCKQLIVRDTIKVGDIDDIMYDYYNEKIMLQIYNDKYATYDIQNKIMTEYNLLIDQNQQIDQTECFMCPNMIIVAITKCVKKVFGIVYDLNLCKKIKEFEINYNVNKYSNINLSPNGRHITIGNENKIYLYS